MARYCLEQSIHSPPWVVHPTSYQDAAVKSYISTSSNLPTGKAYNTSNRGIPDIAIAAHNFFTRVDGISVPVDGTSGSAPAMAVIVAMANSERKKAGLPIMGFLNPFIYNYASTISVDITIGNNACGAGTNCSACCSTGYSAAVGWDATTGVGSIRAAAFIQAAVSPPPSPSPSPSPSVLSSSTHLSSFFF